MRIVLHSHTLSCLDGVGNIGTLGVAEQLKIRFEVCGRNLPFGESIRPKGFFA